MPPSAIRSKATLPGAAQCVSHRDALDAHARLQNAIAEVPDCLAANRCSSRPKTANRKLTASPKGADDLHCAAGVWVLLHGPVCAVGPAGVASPVPTRWS